MTQEEASSTILCKCLANKLLTKSVITLEKNAEAI